MEPSVEDLTEKDKDFYIFSAGHCTAHTAEILCYQSFWWMNSQWRSMAVTFPRSECAQYSYDGKIKTEYLEK